MFLCYQPIDHALAVIGRAEANVLFTIAEHICSNRAGGPQGSHAGSGTSAPPYCNISTDDHNITSTQGTNVINKYKKS